MITAVYIFRICNLLYQIVATFLVYGINLLPASYPALVREWLRCLLILITFLLWLPQFKSYRKKRKLARISFIVLWIISVLFSFFISHSSLSNIFIGIKYWFQWMFILLTSSLIGFVISDKIKQSKILKLFPRILVWIVLIGFIWQWLKLIWPDFFYSLWYGSLDDYAYWENPPIYYLTSYQWTLRRQWLFSWPNNYWYFLVAFLPLVRRFFTKNIKEKTESPIWLNIVALCIRFAGIFMTLSRAVLIWLAVAFVLMYRKQLKKNKKLLLRWWVGILLALVWLSVLKRESTLWHIASKVDVIPEIVNHPLWHWLGSSWPAIHYDWKFLPESYYFQIMLDIWSVGFLFRAIAVLYILWIQFNIVKSLQSNKEGGEQLVYIYSMEIGLFALFVMWLFLHVFEDSMVNYLFFIIYWILLWSLSNNITGELWWKIKLQK